MGGLGDFAKREKKKKKSDKSGGIPSFSSRPTFNLPKMVEKEKRER